MHASWLRRARTWRTIAAVGALALLVSGRAAAASAAAPAGQTQIAQAQAELRTASGALVGTAIFTETESGVAISALLSGLPPGGHGIHIHAVGLCDPPDFESAGPHFDSSGRQHGLDNEAGPHDGDLPTLFAGDDGSARYFAVNPDVTLGLGNPATSLLGAEGRALVVHADSDDQLTDPSGQSGARIACGVIEPVRARR